ncbi:MAG: DNA topoisomerase IV subunit B, partial [Deltaproteobacteria bacterium]|nr:DNA topoisomerase IV subunit B [Deltaproteobacteria bacterium]
LTKAIKGIGEGMRGIKTGGITGSDIIMGLTAVAAIEMPWTPSFEGQTKRRLLSREVQGPVMSIVYQELQNLLAKRKNAKAARNIVELIIAAQQERATTEQLRKVTKNDKGTSLLGKLTPVAGGKRSRPAQERRLWLVEGDSAGGTAKEARDPKRDAILPLRGKVLNVAGKRLSQA